MRRLPPLLALAVILSACGKPATGPQAGGEAPAPSASAPQPEPGAADLQKRLAGLPAPYNTADLTHGQNLFGVCRACHTITPGGANMTGPNLHGVFGRKAASLADYNYSPALKAAGFVWDPQHLDAWLQNPRTYIPGVKMSFAGFKDPRDRTDVIAYLMVQTAPAAP